MCRQEPGRFYAGSKWTCWSAMRTPKPWREPQMARRSRARRRIRHESGAVVTDDARSGARDEDRVSLAPLEFEEALAGLLRTKPTKDEKGEEDGTGTN